MENMSSEEVHPESVRFQPERTHVLAALLMAGISLLVIGAAPRYLFWVLIFPILFLVWVLRARTDVDASGIHVRYAFRGERHIPWEKLSGIGFKGSRALATTTDGQSVMMPGVTFNSLPRLSEASQGRIPDALTAGREAANDKVVIIHRDGQQVLITKEEYAARQAAARQAEDPAGAPVEDDTTAQIEEEHDPNDNSPRSK